MRLREFKNFLNNDYCKLRVNVFDSERSPAAHFEGVEDQNAFVTERLKQMPAYQELARRRGDGGAVPRCSQKAVWLYHSSARSRTLLPSLRQSESPRDMLITLELPAIFAI
jgi:hypothetical protein